MSISDTQDAQELAFRLAEACEQSVDSGDLSVLSDTALAGTLSALLRLLAARAQNDQPVDLRAGNYRLTATDSVIACTSILESASIEVFELAAWQAMTSTGRVRRTLTSQPLEG